VTQQVNLWQPLADAPESPLSARLLLQALGLVALALLVIWGFARQRARSDTARLATLESERTEVQQRLSELEQKSAAFAPDAALAAEVATLAREVEARHALVQAVEQRALGSTTGFSARLAGLARRRVDGVWLARISLAGGGSDLTLGGHALVPALVPDWLEALRGEPAFAGSAFQTVRIEETGQPDAPVAFALSTRAEPGS
jgi:type II secretory pathway component PulM